MSCDLKQFGDAAIYLRMTEEEKLTLAAASRNAAKMAWYPDKDDAYVKAELLGISGGKAKLKVLSGSKEGEEVSMNEDKLEEELCNPVKFDKIEDMANMTFLNEGSVLYNLKQRYEIFMIYTYSGLFCVTVNPYKMLPVYTINMINCYRGKRRNEMPPHLYSIADNAYQDMLQNRKNQSMLITGESGAGKTVNTKKVIQYFSLVAAGEKRGDGQNLEDQIVAANPAMEAFGNAKTTRNDNSSRFGKFIRIHFGPTGKLSSGDIETYLLEKSRVCFQLDGERNYHMFYQLLSNKLPEVVKMTLLELDHNEYWAISMGTIINPSMDDGEELMATDDSFKILEFKQEQIDNIYKIAGGVLHLLNTKFKQKKREEGGEPDGLDDPNKASHLFGISSAELLRFMCAPRVKVGSEYVDKAQTLEQIIYGRAALGKGIFEKLFNWVVKNINVALATKLPKNQFIGCLDIAGFEIFNFNTFEQLCINYTNEKLQQFFNHHMFVLEQEEYKREGIDWVFIDFGLDLATTIELIERPLGILSMLEEECMFPKGSDKTYKEKFFTEHMGKTTSLGKPSKKSKGQRDVTFELYHYAGTVGYNTDGWLDKNKDPINGSVIGILKKSKNSLMSAIWESYKSPEELAELEKQGGKRKKGKGGSFMTVSAIHRESLGRLMTNLRATDPHFVRCIVPNEHKKPGFMEPHLVIHQLRCNGVLEGIRICRKGFPNRMFYPDVLSRYKILNPNVLPKEGEFIEPKLACEKLLTNIGIVGDKFRFGHTKAFFVAGFLAKLEEMRDDRLSSIFLGVQARIRFLLQKKKFAKMLKDREAAKVIQANVRSFFNVKEWAWMRLLYKMKPLLANAEAVKEMDEVVEDLEKMTKENDKNKAKAKELEEANVMLLSEKNELAMQVQYQEDQIADLEERCEDLMNYKIKMDERLKELEERMANGDEISEEMEKKNKELEEAAAEMRSKLESITADLTKTEKEKAVLAGKLQSLTEELATMEEQLDKIQKDKKSIQEAHTQLMEDLQAEEDKVNNLMKNKTKLEQEIKKLETDFDAEKKMRIEMERNSRKLEGDLRVGQETIYDLSDKKEMLEEKLRKLEFDYSHQNTKIEDFQALIMQLQKKIKELQSRIDELEEDLETERTARAKMDKEKTDMIREMEEMFENLRESQKAIENQVNHNKRRENENNKLRREAEESGLRHDAFISNLKKKQQDEMNDLLEENDYLIRLKLKYEKEKAEQKTEIEDLANNVEAITKAKILHEKQSKSFESQLKDAKNKNDEQGRNIHEMGVLKGKTATEIEEMTKLIEKQEGNVIALTKERNVTVQTNLDLKRSLEEEVQFKITFATALGDAKADAERLREQYEEEQETKAELQKLFSKANQDNAELKSKYQQDAVVENGKLEEIRKTLVTRVQELEEKVEQQQAKCGKLEDIKQGHIYDIDELQRDLERALNVTAVLDKKQRSFDRILNEHIHHEDELEVEVEEMQNTMKSMKTELFKTKSNFDESQDNLESSKISASTLQEEVSHLETTLAEQGKNLSHLEKTKRTMETERNELKTSNVDLETQLDTTQGKLEKLIAELQMAKEDTDRRITEKEGEMDSLRKNSCRIQESMQTTIEMETQQKAESIRLRKKLESDYNDLEMQLCQAIRQAADSNRQIKLLNAEIRDSHDKVDKADHKRDDTSQEMSMVERKCGLLTTEIASLREQIDLADRAKKQAESELNESNERANLLQNQNNGLNNIKRKQDDELHMVQGEMEEVIAECRAAEEKCKKATTDVAKITEELKKNQDANAHLDRAKKTLETTIRELQGKLDEAEQTGLMSSRKMVKNAELKLKDFEEELLHERHRSAESIKVSRKMERKVKEILYMQDEDKKDIARLQEFCEKLQGKVLFYKRQSDEYEESSSTNHTKFRKMQVDYEEAMDRADMAETAITKIKSKVRGQAGKT